MGVPTYGRRGMSVARIHGFAFSGIEAAPIEVQARITGGLRGLLVVVLSGAAAGGEQARAGAALAAMGLSLPDGSVAFDLGNPRTPGLFSRGLQDSPRDE